MVVSSQNAGQRADWSELSAARCISEVPAAGMRTKPSPDQDCTFLFTRGLGKRRLTPPSGYHAPRGSASPEGSRSPSHRWSADVRAQQCSNSVSPARRMLSPPVSSQTIKESRPSYSGAACASRSPPREARSPRSRDTCENRSEYPHLRSSSVERCLRETLVAPDPPKVKNITQQASPGLNAFFANEPPLPPCSRRKYFEKNTMQCSQVSDDSCKGRKNFEEERSPERKSDFTRRGRQSLRALMERSRQPPPFSIHEPLGVGDSSANVFLSSSGSHPAPTRICWNQSDEHTQESSHSPICSTFPRQHLNSDPLGPNPSIAAKASTVKLGGSRRNLQTHLEDAVHAAVKMRQSNSASPRFRASLDVADPGCVHTPRSDSGKSHSSHRNVAKGSNYFARKICRSSSHDNVGSEGATTLSGSAAKLRACSSNREQSCNDWLNRGIADSLARFKSRVASKIIQVTPHGFQADLPSGSNKSPRSDRTRNRSNSADRPDSKQASQLVELTRGNTANQRGASPRRNQGETLRHNVAEHINLLKAEFHQLKAQLSRLETPRTNERTSRLDSQRLVANPNQNMVKNVSKKLTRSMSCDTTRAGSEISVKTELSRHS